MKEADKMLWELMLESVFIPPWEYSRRPLNKV